MKLNPVLSTFTFSRATFLGTKGTKFYDLVYIKLNGPANGPYMVIRRWGKVKFLEKGGTISSHNYDSEYLAKKQFRELYNQKNNKPDYDSAIKKTSFDKTLEPVKLFEELSKSGFQTKRIFEYFGFTGDQIASVEGQLTGKFDDLKETNEEIHQKPEVPIVRPENWGSW